MLPTPRLCTSSFAYLISIAMPVAAQTRPTPTISSTIHQTWSLIQRQFIAAADAMPSSRYTFVPENGAYKDVRSFAEQIKHVACNNYAMFNEIEGKVPPQDCGHGGPNPARSKAELMPYLRDSFEYANGVLATIDEKNLLSPVDGPYGGPSTKLGIAVLAVWHASDHYGQLVEYLRMNSFIPPASRRKPFPKPFAVPGSERAAGSVHLSVGLAAYDSAVRLCQQPGGRDGEGDCKKQSSRKQ
jgi:hypothetical protein